eukprot:757109-Hanusia_phi.AAC.1
MGASEQEVLSSCCFYDHKSSECKLVAINPTFAVLVVGSDEKRTMKPSVNTKSALPDEYKKKRKLLEKEEYDRLTERKPGFLDWLSVKQQQYNITRLNEMKICSSH